MNHPGTALRCGTAVLTCLLAWSAWAQDGDDASQKLYVQGQQALAAGRYREAEGDLQIVARQHPDVAEVHATLAVVYFQERMFSNVIREAQRALRLKPGLPRLDSLIAMSQSELGEYGAARPELEKCFAQATDPEVKRMCGLQLERTYTGLHRDDRAVALALELDRLYPKDPEVLYHDAKIFGNFAYLDVQKLGSVAPHSLWERLAAAEAYESQGSAEAAIAAYREVLTLDPHRPSVHYQLGRTLLAHSRQTGSAEGGNEALREFTQELQNDPGNGNAAYEIGEIQRGRGNLDEARKYFEMALDDYPQFEEAHVGLSAVLLAQQQPKLARDHLQSAVALNANDAVAWYRLALVERKLGNSKEQQSAMAEFQRARHNATPTEGSPGVTQQAMDPGAPTL